MSETIAPLVGVLIGGLLAVVGQILANAVQIRAERRREIAMVKAAARLQQHSYWSFQETASMAIRNGSWSSVEIDDRYMPTREDMRVLSSILEPEEWRLYSTAIRMQLEVMQKAREAAGSPLVRSDLVRIFGAYVCAGKARSVISRTSGVTAVDHDPGRLPLSSDEIRESLSHRLLMSETDKWLRLATSTS